MNDNQKKPKKSGMFNKRIFKYGGYSALLTTGLVVIIILVNVAISTLDSYFNLNVDLTANRVYSISTQTTNLLSNMSKDIVIDTTFQANIEDTTVIEILKRYTALTDKITVENIDPVRYPGKVKQYNTTGAGITDGSIIVRNAENTRWRVIPYADLYVVDSDTGQVTQVNVETKLTSAIAYVLSDVNPKAYFLQGHGEASYADALDLYTLLKAENYETDTVQLNTGDTAMEKGDVLIILAPKQDLSETERQNLKDFMANGGRVLFALDPTVNPLPNFDSLLELYGVTLEKGVIYENNANNYYSPYQNYLVPSTGTHDIITPLRAAGLPAVLPDAGSIILPDAAPNGYITITPLLATSDTAWVETDINNINSRLDEGEKAGQRIVAAAIQQVTDSGNEADESRFVVYDSTNFLLSSLNLYGNGDLAINSMAWLRGSESDIYIRGKSLNATNLYFATAAQAITIMVVTWPVVSLAVFAAAIVVYLRRKHL